MLRVRAENLTQNLSHLISASLQNEFNIIICNNLPNIFTADSYKELSDKVPLKTLRKKNTALLCLKLIY